MDFQNKEIEKVEDTIVIISNSDSGEGIFGKKIELFPYGVWYRGQSNKDYCIEPSVFRKENDKCIFNGDIEKRMFVDANLKLYSDTRFMIDKLCLMQHHGLPTRLLDWTESILIALYFTVQNEKDCEDGALYVLNAISLNSYVSFNNSYIFQPSDYEVALRANMICESYEKDILTSAIDELGSVQRERLFSRLSISEQQLKEFESENLVLNTINFESPVAFVPIYKHLRISNQNSVFTIHGGKIPGTENKSWEDSSRKKGGKIDLPKNLEQIDDEYFKNTCCHILVKYKIPGKRKRAIKETLHKLGINRFLIYPDLENRTKHIKEYWKDFA